MSSVHIEGATRDIVSRLVVIILLAVFFSSIVAVFWGSTITRPIIELKDMAEAVGKGNLEVRADARSGDEIGQLDRSFNSMADKLSLVKAEIENTIAKLGDHALSLETEVHERTRDLESSNIRLGKSLEEKVVLLTEVHHRVKNNMAIISSLLNLQSRHTDDKGIKGMFSESQKRIQAMALVHEKLYQNNNFATIDFREYAESLGGDLVRTYGLDDRRVSILTEIDNTTLDLDLLIPFGLIMNELMTNSLKYAFADTPEPEIRIALKGNGGGKVMLSVADNGAGMPEDVDVTRSGTLGLKIVHVLVRQLAGSMEVHRGSGTEFRIHCPLAGNSGES